MKNSTLTLSVSILFIGIVFSSCMLLDKKENKARDKEKYLSDKRDDSIVVKQDTLTAYQKFIIDAENRINTYENEIADLKNKIAKEKQTDKAKYEKKLAQLEQNNEVLKSKVIEYKNKQISDWDNMQLEFRKDLDELGLAIADFFVKEE